ncbi:CDP-diacylglycerol---glycerol-3-phosphate 1-phosphatidyltransferase [Synchytrium endobioticum]|uniref:CDP-diacylglycerol--glycerol-3-phosphate 3-phosphatidyltransferase n=1 Tax=Synchytrium endobioticum TaxID=286115 RepID=A0A507CM01_9FUNG|nr:CDP-diacylglycerol---glycerol-3-phosphate 1-phosphatidyltransferase [Synchytrium endobioticum]
MWAAAASGNAASAPKKDKAPWFHAGDHEQCPLCQTSGFLDKKLVVKVSPCGHRLCENCIRKLYPTAGTTVRCPTEGCRRILRRSDFVGRLFEDVYVVNEVTIRKKLQYDLTPEDFDGDASRYDEYLEKIEDWVYNIVNQVDVEMTEEEIAKFNREFADKIKKEKERAKEEAKEVALMEELIRRRRERMREQSLRELEEKEHIRKNEKEELLKKLAHSKDQESKSIIAEIRTARAHRPKILSSKLNLDESDMIQMKTDESYEVEDSFDHIYVIPDIAIPESLYQGDNVLDLVRISPRARQGGFSLSHYVTRAYREASELWVGLRLLSGSTRLRPLLDGHPSLFEYLQNGMRDYPMFGCRGQDVEILQIPKEFHQAILDGIHRAKRQITLASLYIGSEQSDIVSALQHSLKTKPDLKVHILLDALRGTRDTPSSLSLLSPLLDSKQCRLSFFQPPSANTVLRYILPSRFNEILGLQHMKCYLFDDDVIISGANLSTDYFTNRQDRYVLFKSSHLSAYFDDLISTVGDASYHPVPLSTTVVLDTRNTNSVAQLLQDFVKRWSHKVMADYRDDTVLIPTIQLGVSGIRQDEGIVQDLLENTSSNTSDGRIGEVFLSSAYFNLPPQYCRMMVHSNCVNGTQFKLLTSAPEANGFFNSKGISRFLPHAYTYLESRFLRMARLTRNGGTQVHESDGIAIEEYSRPGWTFHGKGIWCYAPGEPVPHTTIIGSSNFGVRSLKRDMEAQVTILTCNRDLQEKMHQNLNFLRSYATPVDESILTSESRRAHWLTKFTALVCRDML